MQDRQHLLESSQELLKVYNPEDFNTRFFTEDETLLHHWDPDTKKRVHAMEAPWLTPPSASKVMAMRFFGLQRDYIDR